MRGWLAAAMAGFAGLTLTYRLGSFPALHGDEAWIGLFPRELARLGLYTLHGMNDYVGVLYGLLVAGVFSALPPSVASLRLLGVAANGAAGLIVLAHLWRRFGSASGLSWLYLLGTSAFFLFESRLAWEVCALQNLFLAVVLVACGRLIADADFGFGTAWMFLQAIALGVHNHFIFASVPLSLFLLSAAALALEKDWSSLRFFRLAAAAMAMTALLAACQLLLTDGRWQELRWAAGPFLLLLPALAAAAFVRIRDRGDDALRALFGAGFLGGPRGGRGVRVLLSCGLLAFFVFHAAPLLQIWSNVALFQRMVSWDPPVWVSVPLFLWAAALLGAFVHYAAGRLKVVDFRGLPRHERFILGWLLCYGAVFILFRHTSSMRYYLIPSFLLMAGTAVAMPRVGWLSSRRALLALAAMAVCCNVLFWRELRGSFERRPFRFHIGWRHENSGDFVPKDRLLEVMRREGLCDFANNSTFIDLPLEFMMRAEELRCGSPGKKLWSRLCYECEKPPYFEWEVRNAAVAR